MGSPRTSKLLPRSPRSSARRRARTNRYHPGRPPSFRNNGKVPSAGRAALVRKTRRAPRWARPFPRSNTPGATPLPQPVLASWHPFHPNARLRVALGEDRDGCGGIWKRIIAYYSLHFQFHRILVISDFDTVVCLNPRLNPKL